jgi:hypothetical protein
MAAASQITNHDIDIYFSNTHLSQKTKIEITQDGVYIFDPTDGYRYRFTGDTSRYSITIADSGTKKSPYKSVIIKRLLPLCPLSGLPVIKYDMSPVKPPKINEPDRAIYFTQGFAYNCYQVNYKQHNTFVLHPVLYANFALRVNELSLGTIYLVVPIVDGRQMKISQKEALLDYIGNMDVVNIISSYYNELSKKDENFNFHMEDTPPIKADTLYHKSALAELFKQGKLKLGYSPYNEYYYEIENNNIFILEPDAYNYVSFYGKQSYLKKWFWNCEEMMQFRQKIIEEYLD